MAGKSGANVADRASQRESSALAVARIRVALKITAASLQLLDGAIDWVMKSCFGPPGIETFFVRRHVGELVGKVGKELVEQLWTTVVGSEDRCLPVEEDRSGAWYLLGVDLDALQERLDLLVAAKGVGRELGELAQPTVRQSWI